MSASPTAPTAVHTYWGKYRGTVIDNIDPLMTARLLCEVPALPGMVLNWALPCVPFAGPMQGLFALPPIGANVWLEFERGNPGYPIWVGGFWGEGQLPSAVDVSPEDPALVKVLQSQFARISFNDTPGAGGVTISVTDEAVEVPVTLTMNEAGLRATVGEVTLSMNPETGVSISVAETVVSLTEEGISAESTDVTVTAESTSITGAFEVEGEVSITGATTVTGEATFEPAVEINGTLTVPDGVVEMGPEVNVTGAVTIEGDANIAGAATIEGDANIAGALTLEGDANVAGAGQVEGNFAVLGLIEGVIVPPF